MTVRISIRSLIIASILFLLISGIVEEVNASSKGAIAQAMKEKKFLFLFFYEKGSGECDRMSRIIKEAKSKWKDKADFISIDINDSKEREIVGQYRIRHVPVTLVMAPNGVIITGFPGVVGLEELKEAFIPPKMIEIIGGLQERKVIFLCIQNENTEYAKENSKVVKDVADILGKSVKVVEVNPEDKREETLLQRINVQPNITNSTTIVISQTGQIGDRFEGKVTKKELFASFKKVLAQKSGCGSGGASGGCGGG